MATHLDDREEDLWGRGAQSHESQVGDGLIPDPYSAYAGLPIALGDSDFLLLGCNDFNGGHKAVSNDGHTQEHVDHGHKVDHSSGSFVAQRGIIRLPHRQQDARLTACRTRAAALLACVGT